MTNKCLSRDEWFLPRGSFPGDDMAETEVSAGSDRCKLARTGFSLPPSWKFTSHPLYLLSKVHPFISAEPSVCSAERTRRGIQPRQGEGPFQVKGPMNYVNLRTTFMKQFFFFCLHTNPTEAQRCKDEHRAFMQISHFTFKFLSPVIHDVPENQ